MLYYNVTKFLATARIPLYASVRPVVMLPLRRAGRRAARGHFDHTGVRNHRGNNERRRRARLNYR